MMDAEQEMAGAKAQDADEARLSSGQDDVEGHGRMGRGLPGALGVTSPDDAQPDEPGGEGEDVEGHGAKFKF